MQTATMSKAEQDDFRRMALSRRRSELVTELDEVEKCIAALEEKRKT